MIRFAINVLITACLIAFVLPYIPGVHFNGSFWPDAVIYGALFAVVSVVVNLLLLFISAAFTLATSGFGAIPVLILYILGWWLIPAIQLMALAHWFPQHLAIDSWFSAIIAGVVLLVVNLLTHRAGSSSSDN